MPELVWNGKDDGEGDALSSPLRLVDDPSCARLSAAGAADDNRLIYGDNGPALALLHDDFAGRIACIYADPPYNAHAVTDHYDDRADHADWLAFMRRRLVSMRALLRDDGSLFLQVDDNEVDYLKVLADEIFGRRNFISRITVAARSPSAFSTVNRGLFKASEYILWYARDRSRLREYPLRVARAPDRAYNKWLLNPDEPCENWRFQPLLDAYHAASERRRSVDPVRAVQHLDRFIVRNAARVCRLASISDTGAGQETVALKYESLRTPGVVHRRQRPGYEDVFVLDGKQLLFYDRNVVELDGMPEASVLLTTIWTDIAWEGIAREGRVRFKKGKKPERLLRRCLDLTTQPGDWVLDAFAGSGTTGAVAHKMGRRWVMIEQGPQCFTHILPRLNRVIDGDDATGISRAVGWTGGGGFRFQRLVG